MVIDIPGYKIIRQIGAGGMAVVYLAVQEALDREVALKVMSLQVTGQDTSFQERFLREGKSIANLSHYRIVGVYDMGAVNGNFYIAMEYLNGGSLKDKIQAGLTPEQALDIIKAIAESLGFAHKKGYVHRDVKPMNILFRGDGSPVLTDFGIAKIVLDAGAELTSTGLIMGTPSYMSPEQAKGEVADGRSDLYSLGIVFYEMLIGIVPFTADTAIAVLMKHVNDDRPALPEHLRRYQYLLDRLLAKNPNDRFSNADEFIYAAAHEDEELVATTIHPNVQPPVTKKPKKKSLKTAVISSVLLIAFGGMSFLGYQYMSREVAPIEHVDNKNSLLENSNKVVAERPAIEKSSEKSATLDKVQEKKNEEAKILKNSLESKMLAKQNAEKKVEKLLVLAEQKWSSGELEETERLIQDGLNMDSEHQKLKILQIKVQDAIQLRDEGEAKKIKIQALYEQIKTLKSDDSEVKKTIQAYQAIIRLDANNEKAKQGLDDTMHLLYENALKMDKPGHETAALSLLDYGLSVQDNVKLKILKNKISVKIRENKEIQHKKNKINNLLVEANEYADQLELLGPGDKNAYGIYQKILKIDPNNAKAKMGIKHVVNELAELAKVRVSVNDKQNGLALVEKGLSIDPKHPGLLALKQKIQTKEAAKNSIFAPFSQQSENMTPDQSKSDIIFTLDQ